MGASIKKIKTKMQATQKTSQITKAMNMVSASKLRGAEHAIRNYLPFIEKIEEIIANLLNAESFIKHPLLVKREIKKTCYILITSERGLAGPFNNNLFKRLELEIAKNDHFVIAPLGTKGYVYCRKNKYPLLIDDHVILRDDVNFSDVAFAIKEVVLGYIREDFDSVEVIYNHYINTLTQVVTVKRMLPIENEFQGKKTQVIYDFEGGVASILNEVLPLYIENLIYGLTLDSKAAEHASRMVAMKSATDNAEDIIDKLELMYNRARQASITLELTDIIGGASSVSTS
ncbi:MAG: ATP synthase F1 subunit gamma [Bacilli bacterium]|jgi:F-type H+-transporting ATPase subunit gamma|nr:ATP synthase F1 subunit gamma [Bacilli bacterium]